MGAFATLQDFADLLGRHRRLVRNLTVAGLVFGGLIALSQPELFRSAETTGYGLSRADHRAGALGDLRVAERQLLSRGHLLDIATGLHLYGGRPELSADDIAALLRRRITVETVAVPDRGETPALPGRWITVTADMPTAGQAVQVAREMSARFDAFATRARTGRLERALEDITARETVLEAEAMRLKRRAGLAPRSPGHAPPVAQDRLRRIQTELATLSERRTGIQTAHHTGMPAETIARASPASVPLPRYRFFILAAGAAAGFGLALALAVFLDLRRPVLRTARQMERKTGLTPLVCIPVLETTPQKPSLWRRAGNWL